MTRTLASPTRTLTAFGRGDGRGGEHDFYEDRDLGFGPGSTKNCTSQRLHLCDGPKWPKVAIDSNRGDAMLSMSAKDAKYGFGRLIDLARAEPVVVEKHGRPVIVVMAVEEFERLKAAEFGHHAELQAPHLSSPTSTSLK